MKRLTLLALLVVASCSSPTAPEPAAGEATDQEYPAGELAPRPSLEVAR